MEFYKEEPDEDTYYIKLVDEIEDIEEILKPVSKKN